MGLQDEKVKPGKVMKANKGKSAMVPLKKGYSKALGVFPTINKVKPSVGGSGMGKGTDKVSTKKAEDFMKRRKQLGGGKLKALTRVMGSRAALLGLVGAGAVAGLNKAGKKLKEFADKKKEKKMGGGMMKKYSKGGGADSGTEGERRSIMGVYENKVRRFLKGAGKTRGRMTEEDIKKASSLVKGKMGGGMMQKTYGL